jgi:hypothetical protein
MKGMIACVWPFKFRPPSTVHDPRLSNLFRCKRSRHRDPYMQGIHLFMRRRAHGMYMHFRECTRKKHAHAREKALFSRVCNAHDESCEGLTVCTRAKGVHLRMAAKRIIIIQWPHDDDVHALCIEYAPFPPQGEETP